MRSFRAGTLVAFVGAGVLLGCGTHGSLDLDSLPGTTPPGGSPTPSGTTTPPGFDTGDGSSGALSIPSGTQNVNVCSALPSAAAGASVVTLADATPFTSGRALLIQVQDDFATSGDSTPISAPGNAGVWEIATITASDATTVTLAAPLLHAYSSAGTARAEICTVPQYTDVTIGTGIVRATAWNGVTGGVVAFFASGTVLFTDAAGTVSASFDGFRGGGAAGSGGAFGITSLDTSAANGGFKGEGLDGRARGLHGRGNYANGGGAGNALLAGGAGGGNGGAGGAGGIETDANPMPSTLTAGLGGGSVTASVSARLTMGGGGGGGHQVTGNGGTGGNGGGIVLVFAARVSGPGQFVANGGSGGDGSGVTVADGGGGGGAGGTIFVATTDGDGFTGEVDAFGRAGGNVDNPSATLSGPGGGGAGGRILLVGLPNAQPAAVHGAAGANLMGSDAHGALPGSDGVIVSQ